MAALPKMTTGTGSSAEILGKAELSDLVRKLRELAPYIAFLDSQQDDFLTGSIPVGPDIDDDVVDDENAEGGFALHSEAFYKEMDELDRMELDRDDELGDDTPDTTATGGGALLGASASTSSWPSPQFATQVSAGSSVQTVPIPTATDTVVERKPGGLTVDALSVPMTAAMPRLGPGIGRMDSGGDTSSSGVGSGRLLVGHRRKDSSTSSMSKMDYDQVVSTLDALKGALVSDFVTRQISLRSVRDAYDASRSVAATDYSSRDRRVSRDTTKSVAYTVATSEMSYDTVARYDFEADDSDDDGHRPIGGFGLRSKKPSDFVEEEADAGGGSDLIMAPLISGRDDDCYEAEEEAAIGGPELRQGQDAAFYKKIGPPPPRRRSSGKYEHARESSHPLSHVSEETTSATASTTFIPDDFSSMAASESDYLRILSAEESARTLKTSKSRSKSKKGSHLEVSSGYVSGKSGKSSRMRMAVGKKSKTPSTIDSEEEYDPRQSSASLSEEIEDTKEEEMDDEFMDSLPIRAPIVRFEDGHVQQRRHQPRLSEDVLKMHAEQRSPEFEATHSLSADVSASFGRLPQPQYKGKFSSKASTHAFDGDDYASTAAASSESSADVMVAAASAPVEKRSLKDGRYHVSFEQMQLSAPIEEAVAVSERSGRSGGSSHRADGGGRSHRRDGLGVGDEFEEERRRRIWSQVSESAMAKMGSREDEEEDDGGEDLYLSAEDLHKPRPSYDGPVQRISHTDDERYQDAAAEGGGVGVQSEEDFLDDDEKDQTPGNSQDIDDVLPAVDEFDFDEKDETMGRISDEEEDGGDDFVISQLIAEHRAAAGAPLMHSPKKRSSQKLPSPDPDSVRLSADSNHLAQFIRLQAGGRSLVAGGGPIEMQRIGDRLPVPGDFSLLDRSQDTESTKANVSQASECDAVEYDGHSQKPEAVLVVLDGALEDESDTGKQSSALSKKYSVQSASVQSGGDDEVVSYFNQQLEALSARIDGEHRSRWDQTFGSVTYSCNKCICISLLFLVIGIVLGLPLGSRFDTF